MGVGICTAVDLQEEEPDDVLFNIKTGKVSSAHTKKKFLTIEQWMDAFSVYSSVYRFKLPAGGGGFSLLHESG